MLLRGILGVLCSVFLITCRSNPLPLQDYASARFWWNYQDNVLPRADAISPQELHKKLIRGAIRVGDGSGVAFMRSGDFTFLLTCHHVVADFRAGKEYVNPEIMVIHWDGPNPVVEMGRVLYSEGSVDLAVVVVQGEHPIFPIMSDDDYKRLIPGMEVAAGGHPASIIPCVVAYGFVDRTNAAGPRHNSYLAHNATGWYGFSGGPVLLRSTGEIIGIESNFDGQILSYKALAVSSPVIRRFLAAAFLAISSASPEALPVVKEAPHEAPVPGHQPR